MLLFFISFHTLFTNSNTGTVVWAAQFMRHLAEVELAKPGFTKQFTDALERMTPSEKLAFIASTCMYNNKTYKVCTGLLN